MKLSLMKHQEEALEFLKGKSGAGLFFEMGLGKTVVVLEWLLKFWNSERPPAFPVLIVCPLSVVSVWEKEVEKFNFPFKVVKLTGTTHERLEKLSHPADIYVINYEGMRILIEALVAKGFPTVILDESHRIKERSSQQTSAALRLASLAKRRLALTGTPVTKSPEDIWTQLHFLSPGSLDNFWAFRTKYIDFRTIRVRMPGGFKEIKKAHRFKHLEELEGRISQHCLRRTKAECLDLPEKIYKKIYCEMGPAQSKAYYEIKHNLATELEHGTINLTTAAAALQKLQQICQGFVYDEAKTPNWIRGSAKLDALKDLLIDIGEEKTIVFGWYKADIERLRDELSKTHQVFFYCGNADERGNIVDAFQNHEGPAIFLAQIETAKEGITLTAANHVIYFGNSWNYGSRMQSEDRAHRAGQRRNVLYYDLVIPGTIDETISYALKNKGAMADRITGDSIRLAKLVCGLETLEEGD